VNVRATWILSGLLALALVPSSLVAQDGWTFRGTAEAGVFRSTRDLGKNVGDLQEFEILQVRARMEPATVYGGGVEAVAPDGRTMFRVLFRGTFNGTATGSVPVCDLFEQTSSDCDPRVVDATMASFLGEVVFLQGTPGDKLRQNFIIGAGLRSYQFTADACDPDVTNPVLYQICELILPIYEDQSPVQPFAEFGFGLMYGTGPIDAFVRVLGIVGSYQGGSGSAEGGYQTDVTLVGGLSFRVR